ncbi:MAG: HAMP domain-containing histidine kinase [Labilithrix sp.]|nr:HAMP domain-containing histidine kinase [Labilithrix sp.]
MSAPQPSPVDDIVTSTAFRWEAMISGVRAVFCAVVFGRLGLLHFEVDAPRIAIEAALCVVLMVVSLWVMARARSARATPRLLVGSVAIDALGCFLALFVNVVIPWPGYDGILRVPDAAAILVVAMAAGFRLSPTAAAVGAALHAAGAATLVGVDLTRNADLVAYRAPTVVLFAILVLSAIALALVMSTQVRRLVQLAAKEHVSAESAKMSLWHVLEGNHEMRSALSAVALETELFLRAAQRSDDRDDLVRVGGDLRAELARLNELVVGMRERAYAELAAMQGAAHVGVRAVADEVVSRARARFPEVAVELRGGEEDVRVVVAGGATSLDRVLSNLVTNACEGDGRARPSRVTVDVERAERDRVRIVVRDDGPGFSPEVLAASLDARGPSTKADGSGLGLFLVRAIASATGGSLARRNAGGGGAEVVVELPGAPR